MLVDRLQRRPSINPFKPEFTIVIFIHYKPRIAVAILDLQWMKITFSGRQMKKKFNEHFFLKLKFSNLLEMQNAALMHR